MSVLACAGSPTHEPEATILAFGDSLTSGVGGSGESYPARLAQRLDREVVNAGIPGETTAQGRKRLARVLGHQRPGLLILCLGLNDFLQDVPRAEVRENLLAMLATAREFKVPVLLLAVPQPGQAFADPIFEEVARMAQVPVDKESMVRVLGNPRLKADLVHPNAEGYREIAEHLATTLIAMGLHAQ